MFFTDLTAHFQDKNTTPHCREMTITDTLNTHERKVRICKHNLNSHTRARARRARTHAHNLKYFPEIKLHYDSNKFYNDFVEGNGAMRQFLNTYN